MPYEKKINSLQRNKGAEFVIDTFIKEPISFGTTLIQELTVHRTLQLQHIFAKP